MPLVELKNAWAAGQEISASKLDDLRKLCNENRVFSGGDNVIVQKSSATGTRISLDLSKDINMKWNKVVVFKNQNGLSVKTVAGTQTAFIRVHYADDQAGLVEYCDGTSVENWAPGTQEYRVSDLPKVLFVP